MFGMTGRKGRVGGLEVRGEIPGSTWGLHLRLARVRKRVVEFPV